MPQHKTITDKFETLLKIYSKLTPPLVSGLNPPASLSEIREAENELEIKFPDDLRQLLLYANGQPYPETIVSPFLPGLRFADTDWQGIASYGWLADLNSIVERVKWTRGDFEIFQREEFELTGPVSFHNHFIDFTISENSDNLVLDLMPEVGGKVGQVVMMRTQPCHLAVLAPSISNLLDMVTDGFLNGRFKPNAEGVCPVWCDGGW